MPTPRKRTKKAEIAVEDMGPSERIAHEIVTEFGDLAPSLQRIMDAELSDDERFQAMTLFQNSLGNIGDPHRDPRVAIANSAASR